MSKINSAISGAAAGGSVGGVPGGIIGGVGGYLLGQDDQSKDYYQQMLDEAKSIPLPVLKEMNPELYRQVVSMNPELEQAITLGPSAMEGISTDPRLRQAQMNALMKLQEISDAGGKDAQFMADSARLQNNVNSTLKGNTEAIKQNLATRGMSGGMTEMVSRNQAAQESANRQAQMGLDINAQAQQRALQALMSGANLGGQMQQQDFSQQSQVASAKDAISKFNAMNSQDVRQRNAAIKNNTQQWNSQNAQNVSNQNVGVKNQAQQYNNNIPQMQYDNELKKRGMINTGYGNMAQNSYNQSRDQDEFLGGVFSSVASSYKK